MFSDVYLLLTDSVATPTPIAHLTPSPPKLLQLIIITVIAVSLLRKMEIILVISNRRNLTKGIAD